MKGCSTFSKFQASSSDVVKYQTQDHQWFQILLCNTNDSIQHLHTVKWYQVLLCNTNNLI